MSGLSSAFGVSRTRVACVVVVMGLTALLGAVAASAAWATGGSYTIKWNAADPALNRGPFLPTYAKVYPPPSFVPVGRAADPAPLKNAVAYAPSGLLDAVSSLAPKDLAIGQIVPFEVVITVGSPITPENGVITFTGGWSTYTTGGAKFGYDPARMVIAAFVDTADAGTTAGATATVDSISSTLANANTTSEEIQSTIQLSGLRSGDRVVVEVWLALRSTLPSKAVGNVQSRLISAKTVAGGQSANIQTGNQTVPLLQVNQFYSQSSADVSVTKADSPDPAVAGSLLTYTLTARNNSSTTVANGVTLYDTLDPNAVFVSASDGGVYSSATGMVTWPVTAIAPLSTLQRTVVVRVGDATPTQRVTGFAPDARGGTTSPANPTPDMVNRVTKVQLTPDPTPANDVWYQPTNVLPSGLRIVKTDSSTGGLVARTGSLTYTLTVTNTSTTTAATNVVVADTLDANEVYVSASPAYTTMIGRTLTWSLGTLAAGATATITVNVTLGATTPTTADPGASGAFDPLVLTDPTTAYRGTADLFNYATVIDGTEGPQSYADNGSYRGTGVTDIQADISLVKSGSPGVYTTAGQTITYTYRIRNSGNSTLTTPFAVSDNKTTVVVTPPAGNQLLPGQETTGTATYTITAADVTAGSVTNTATASGYAGAVKITSPTATETVFKGPATIGLTKNASPATFTAAGQTITYAYTITNTGGAPVYGPITVSDDKTLVTVTQPVSGVLLAGQVATGTATYTTTADDVNAGSVVNVARAAALDPDRNAIASADASKTVTCSVSRLTLSKTASPEAPTSAQWVAGQTITYTYILLNNGTTDLTGPFTITDNKVSVTVTQPSDNTLSPGETTTGTATYTLTSTDVTTNGYVTNTASASGKDPSNNTVTAPQVQVTVSGPATTSLSIAKNATLDPVVAGQNIGYSVTAANDSVIDALGVTIVDELPSGATFVSASGGGVYTAGTPAKVTWTIGTLAASTSVSREVTITVSPSNPTEIFPGPTADGRAGTTAPTGTDLLNKATVNTTSADGDPSNNTWYLATNVVTPTLAVVGSFDVYEERDRVVIAWTTVGEVGTAGLRLQRRDGAGRWHAVHRELIPAVPVSPAGARYAVADPAARAGQKLTYRLVEVEVGGGTVRHGPYTRVATAAPPAGGIAGRALSRGGFIRTPLSPVTASSSRRARVSTPLPAAAATDRLRIETAGTGLYRIEATDVATGLAVDAASAAKLIAGKAVRLTTGGADVAYLTSADGRILYFYAEGTASQFASRNVYWLTRGKGTAVRAAPATTSAGALRTTVTDTLHVEQDVAPATAVCHDPAGDLWLWTVLSAGGGTWGTGTFGFTAPEALQGVRLDVALQGITASGREGEHLVEVKLNGTVLGTAQWTGATSRVASFSVPAAILLSGANELTVTAVLGAGIPYSMVGVDSFDVTYLRSTRTSTGSLRLQAPAACTVRVDGVAAAGSWVLDLADPRMPQTARISGGGGTGQTAWLSFAAAAPGRIYYAAAAASARRPDVVAPAAGTGLRTGAADYLVITAAALRSAAQELADYRSSRGLATRVVTTQEIYDEFSAGLPSPFGIRDFIACAATTWRPAPRYVVLAGDGSFDYRGVTASGPSLVPPLMVDTPRGVATSDAALADGTGDGVPDVAVGRIPATTAAQLSGYVAKLKAYEADAGDWRRRAILAADDPDASGDFSAGAERLAATLPQDVAADRVYAGSLGATAARSRLLQSLAQGAVAAAYIGHAGVQQLADEGLLTSADVPALRTAPRLPVFLALTCVAGYISLPGGECIAETLVNQPDGGAVAVLAPSTSEADPDSVAYGAQVLTGLFASRATRIGPVVQKAAADFAAGGGPRLVVSTYNLLGDPATEVRW